MIGPAEAISVLAAIAGILGTALGAHLFRWEQYIWQGGLLIWVLLENWYRKRAEDLER